MAEDSITSLLLWGGAAYVAYLIYQQSSPAASTAAPTSATGTSGAPGIFSLSGSPSSSSSSSSGFPSLPSGPSASSGGANPGGVSLNAWRTPTTSASFSGGMALDTTAPAPRMTPTVSSGGYSSPSDATMAAEIKSLNQDVVMTPAQAAAQNAAMNAASAAAETAQQAIGVANAAAQQQAFNQQNAKFVYCGPGCYDVYDSQGNLTKQGVRGQGAGGWLSQVAAGVSGMR